MSRKLLGIEPQGATTEQLFRVRNEEFHFRNAMGGPEFTMCGRRPQLPTNATEHYRATPTSFGKASGSAAITKGRTETYDKMQGIATEMSRKSRVFK